MKNFYNVFWNIIGIIFFLTRFFPSIAQERTSSECKFLNQIEISQLQHLFTAGDDGIVQFRIPSMITTKNGIVLAVCDGRVDRPGDVPNNIDLVLRRLKKGSKEWVTVKRIVNFAGEHGACDPSLLQDRSTGNCRTLIARVRLSGMFLKREKREKIS